MQNPGFKGESKMSKRFIYISAALLILCTNSWAQLYTTHISGRIIIGDGSTAPDNTTFLNFSVNLYKQDYTSWDVDARRLIATVPVAKNGAFIFMDVIPDQYVVEPYAVGNCFDTASINVTVRAADIDDLVFRTIAGMSISGRFRNFFYVPQNNVLVTLYDNQPYAGAPTPNATEIGRTVSTEDGRYTFPGLKAGSYLVRPVVPSQQIAEPTTKNVNLAFENQPEVNFVISSYCSETYITFPFWGSYNHVVDVIGLNFGPKPTDNDSATKVAVTLSDGTTTSLYSAGVYFGTNDPATWVQAKVYSWSEFDISVKVPKLNGRLVRVWVVKPGLNTCINLTPSNFFFNTRD